MKRIPATIKYTPAIDGLRALAVISVIIHHFNSNILPGGYLGVDIFFVISGFVITSSLANREDNRFGEFFLGFYKRRIKRLLPALLLCCGITGILISFFNPSPQDHIKTGLFSLIGLANIDLYLNAVNYWGDSAKLNPFTHTWSLGVEEQFYLFFPLLVWFFLRGKWTPLKTRRLLWLLLFASTISLFSFVFLSKSNQAITYFLLPYRFWEIGFGAALALYLFKESGRNYINHFIESIPNEVFLVLTIIILFFPKNYNTPSTIAIVCSTLLLLLNIKQKERNGREYNGVLSHRITLYLGVISYSLYLWHWVIIVISRWTIGLDIWTIPFQIMSVVIFSTLSYHLVEKPFRNSSWRSSKHIQVFLVTTLVIVSIALTTLMLGPGSNRLYLGNIEKDTKTKSYYINSELDCGGHYNRTEKQKIRTLGNSHANHILPMLELISSKCGLEILYQKHPDYIVIPSGNDRNRDMLDGVLSTLNEGDLIILSSRNRFLYSIPYLNSKGDRWLNHTDQKKSKGFGLDVWLGELDELLAKAEKSGVNVVLFLPNVEFDQQVVNYQKMCTNEWFKRQPQGCNPQVSKKFLNSRFPQKFYEEVQSRSTQSKNFYIFDPMPIFCPQEGECSRIIDGVVAFGDTNHLSPDGAKLMLDKFSLFLARNNLIKN